MHDLAAEDHKSRIHLRYHARAPLAVRHRSCVFTGPDVGDLGGSTCDVELLEGQRGRVLSRATIEEERGCLALAEWFRLYGILQQNQSSRVREWPPSASPHAAEGGGVDARATRASVTTLAVAAIRILQQGIEPGSSGFDARFHIAENHSAIARRARRAMAEWFSAI